MRCTPRSIASSRRSSASRPTRPPTPCTSCCASSSSRQLIDGTLAVADLPEAWNARFEEYFGIAVTDDADGVLQDVHWSAGMFGYFPTYALGNLIAGQLWERAHADMPDLDAQLAAGELIGFARVAARAHPPSRREVHDHRAAGASDRGADLGRPFANYLKAKLSDVYGIGFQRRRDDAAGLNMKTKGK